MIARTLVASLRHTIERLDSATPGEWPSPQPARWTPHHVIGDGTPRIAAVKREQDAAAIVAAVNFLRTHGSEIERAVSGEGKSE